jgi:hypothetical protein
MVLPVDDRLPGADKNFLLDNDIAGYGAGRAKRDIVFYYHIMAD